MKLPPSLIFYSIFTVALVAATALVVASFSTILDVFPSLDSIRNISSDDNRDRWSSAADVLAVVFGAPVAVAGSIAAIYIARQAYSVSIKQSEFETTAYVDQMADRTAETYWAISMRFQELDAQLNSMVDAALTIPRDDFKHTYQAEPIEEFQKRLDRHNMEFRKAYDTLATSVLLVLRDPLSSECWKAMSATQPALFKDGKHPHGMVIGARSHLISQSDKDPGSLTQAIRQALGRIDIARVRDPSLSVRLVTSKFASKRMTWNKDTGTYQKKVPAIPRHHNRLPRQETPQKVEVKNFTVSDLMDRTHEDILKVMDDPLYRLLCAGALLQITNYVDPETKEKMTYNSGAELLVAVIRSIPSESAQETAMKSFLNKSAELTAVNKNRSLRSLTDKNIAEYLLPKLREAADKIYEDPDLLCMHAP